jgi:membrane protein implicated in regulation of membrane protease activity
MDSNLIPWIFASFMVSGSIYMLMLLIFGELSEFGDFDADLDLDFDADIDLDLDLDGDVHSGEGLQIGCASIAAFFAAFGALGLAGSLAGVGVAGNFVGATVFGLLVGRLVIAALTTLKRQESTRVQAEASLLGKTARVTINSASGKVGEAMIEAEQVLKFPIKEVNDAPLQRGDAVQVVDVRGGYLFVEKQAEAFRVRSEVRS